MWKGFNCENLSHRRAFPTQVKHRKRSIDWHLPQIPINMAKNTVPSLSNRWDCWKRGYGKGEVPQRSRRHTGHEQGDILLTQQDTIYFRYLSKLLITHTFVVEFKLVTYTFGLLLFLKWCLINILSVRFTQDERHVELSFQKGHFLSQRGHITILPPISASHISLLKGLKKRIMKNVTHQKKVNTAFKYNQYFLKMGRLYLQLWKISI